MKKSKWLKNPHLRDLHKSIGLLFVFLYHAHLLYPHPIVIRLGSFVRGGMAVDGGARLRVGTQEYGWVFYTDKLC